MGSRADNGQRDSPARQGLAVITARVGQAEAQPCGGKKDLLRTLASASGRLEAGPLRRVSSRPEQKLSRDEEDHPGEEAPHGEGALLAQQGG